MGDLFAAEPRSGEEISDRPLADRMRPLSLADFSGQQHLLASGKPLQQAIEQGRAHSSARYQAEAW